MYKYLVFLLFLLSSCAINEDKSLVEMTPSIPPIPQVAEIKTQESKNIEVETLLVQAELLCPDFSDCPKPQEALNILDKTIVIDPKFIEAYELRAISLSNLGYHQDALNDMTKVIVMRSRQDPKLGQSYLRRSHLFTLTGNKLGANKDLEQAAKLIKK